MDSPSRAIRDLARRLISAEAGNAPPADSKLHQASRVTARLQVSITRLAGPDGFKSLLSRAFALAQVERPTLHEVTLDPDGTFHWPETMPVGNPVVAGEDGVLIVAHLLWLLVTFIGESLMLRLVRESWPDAAFLDNE